jgi:hypothetical protein
MGGVGGGGRVLKVCSGNVTRVVCQASELRRDRAWPVADVRISRTAATAYESKQVLRQSGWFRGGGGVPG